MPDRFDQYYASFRRGNSALRVTLIVSVLVHVLVLLGLLGWYRLQLKTEPVAEFTMFVVPNDRPDEPLEQAMAPEVNELEQPDEAEAPPPPPPPPPPEPPKPEPPKPEPPKPEPPKPKPDPPKEVKKSEALALDPEPEGEGEEPEEEMPEPPKPEPPKPKEPEKPKPKPKEPEVPKKPTPEPPKPEAPKPEPPKAEPPKPQAAPAPGTLRMAAGKADRPDLASWANRVQRKVERVWAKPGGISLDPVSSTVEVTFWVDRNGNLLDEPRVSSVGSDPRLAESAINAVKLAAPYSPLPESFSGPELVVKYEFSLAR